MVIAVVLVAVSRRTVERSVVAARGLYDLRRVLSRTPVLVQLLFLYLDCP